MTSMKKLIIEFFGDAGRMHNVRFKGETYASNEVLLGLFYEEVGPILEDMKAASGGVQNPDYDFGDFISGSLARNYVTIEPDGIESKSYKVRTSDLIEILEKWEKFRTRNRNRVVKTIVIEAEVY